MYHKMGNIFTLEPDYYNIKFCQESIPIKYLYEIRVDGFHIDNIKTQINQINSLANDTNTIIKVLEHIQNTETIAILEQVDGYLFNKFRGQMPYLAIINTSAVHKQCTNSMSSSGYYYKYILP